MTILVAIGGFCGAIARFFISNLFQRNQHTPFPIGTFCVNILGSFLLGLLTMQGIGMAGSHLLAVGFLGSFTTFSTMHLEMFQLYQGRKLASMIGYVLASYGIGIAAAFFGASL